MFQKFPKKRTTSRVIHNFFEISSWDFPELSFFSELSVKWFIFEKFDSFLIFFTRKFPNLLLRFEIFGIGSNGKAPTVPQTSESTSCK